MAYLWRHWGGGSSRRDNSGLGLDRWLMWWGQYLNIVACCRYHLGDRAVAGGGVMGQGSRGSSDERSPRTTESPACNWRDSTPRQLASSQEEQSTRFFIRVGPQVEKSPHLHITADLTGSIHKNAGGKKFDPKKVRLGWGNLSWKFGSWAFSEIFVLFFGVAKTLIYIDNAFNGYSYLKSTRKELSDGTLMLKKEYRLAR